MILGLPYRYNRYQRNGRVAFSQHGKMKKRHRLAKSATVSWKLCRLMMRDVRCTDDETAVET